MDSEISNKLIEECTLQNPMTILNWILLRVCFLRLLSNVPWKDLIWLIVQRLGQPTRRSSRPDMAY